MSRHKHDWQLIDKGNTRPKYRPLPKGQWVSRGGLFGGITYIPGFDMQMLHERIIDTIQSSDMPYYEYQTWQCPECGKMKKYEQRVPGITELLSQDKVSDLLTEDSKPSTGNTEAQSPAPTVIDGEKPDRYASVKVVGC